MQAWPIILVVSVSIAVIGHLRRTRSTRRTIVDEATPGSAGDVVVKELLRADGMERVRIFRRPNQTFRADVQHRAEEAEAWFTDSGPLSGAAYASIEIAEREVAVVVPWLRQHQNA